MKKTKREYKDRLISDIGNELLRRGKTVDLDTLNHLSITMLECRLNKLVTW